MIVIFFGPASLFVFCAVYFLPKQAAVMCVGLAGFVMIVAGPFWAMSLERRLMDRYMPKKREPIDRKKVEEFLKNNE